MLSLSSIACIVEICLPLGATRGRLGRRGLSSEVSLPPVSILCEEFDCVPAAGATACPEKENALSLLSCSVICKVRGYPLVGSVGEHTADNLWIGDSIRYMLLVSGELNYPCSRQRDHSFGMNALFSGTCSCSDLSQRGIRCDPLATERLGLFTWEHVWYSSLVPIRIILYIYIIYVYIFILFYIILYHIILYYIISYYIILYHSVYLYYIIYLYYLCVHIYIYMYLYIYINK